MGPTIDYTWPRQYLEDTEKYGNQTRLVKINTGGYGIENYAAGLPFPIPDHSQFGYKISYNVRYSPGAAVALWPFTGLSVDEFLNVRTISGTLEFYRLSHLSTPGKPVNPAYGKGYLNSIRADLTAPEDVRYLVQVTLQPEDPTRVSEQYVFVPWIRRSLRLSAGSRCTYQNNSDAANRDLSVDVANYRVKLLGAATILALEHPVSDPAVLYNQYNIQVQSSVPGWPKPALGRWEPRRVYMIDSMPLPVLGNYCVSHSVAYVDADSWVPLVVEDYDTEGRLWRIYVNTWMEVRGPKNEGNYMVLHHNEVLNLKEGHATLFTITSPPMIDSEVPLQYRNAAQSAMPGALSFINK